MAENALPVENVTMVKWGALVLLGVVSLIFGLLIILFPLVSAAVLVELIGILIILTAFSALVFSALAPGGWKESVLLAILGILGFFFGIATVIHPIIMGQVIVMIVGISLFLGGLIGIVLAFSEPHIVHRGLFALQGVLAIIIGLLISVFPLFGVALVVIWVGAILALYGIAGIVLGYSIRACSTA
ncbi:HdeD family acid-resistance protein [Methanoregula sp.]|uniref:HdeD family acid-resistance protein n=1 Tax=Methanoregula sp. TaxID=2052170 RepID=UPI003BAFBC27